MKNQGKMKIVPRLAVIFLLSNLVCHAQETPEFNAPGWFRPVERAGQVQL